MTFYNIQKFQKFYSFLILLYNEKIDSEIEMCYFNDFSSFFARLSFRY